MVAFSEKKLSRRPRIKHMRMWNETLEVHYRSRNIWCGKRSRQSTTCHQRLSSCFETEKSTIFSVDWNPQMTVWKINWIETKFTVKRPGQRDNRVSLPQKAVKLLRYLEKRMRKTGPGGQEDWEQSTVKMWPRPLSRFVKKGRMASKRQNRITCSSN